MPLIHFLLVYDLDKQQLLEQHEFGDPVAAAAAYAELEQKHHGERNLEIVLVGADSIDTVKITHGNYFDGVTSASPFLDAVA